MKKLVLAVACGLLLSGCSAASADTAPEDEAPAGLTALEYCDAHDEALAPYLDVVSNLMAEDESFDSEAWRTVDGMLEREDASGLPQEWAAANANYMSMRSQINEALANPGSATLNSDAFKQGSLELMALCVAAGFTSKR